MASTTNWFTRGLYHLMNGDVDMNTDTVKVMLCTSDFTPSKNVMEYRDEVTAQIRLF